MIFVSVRDGISWEVDHGCTNSRILFRRLCLLTGGPRGRPSLGCEGTLKPMI